MAELHYREARDGDVPAMAEIRAADWGTPEYWQERIRRYMAGELNARQAVPGHICLVAVESDRIAGLIAGHLTRRFGCDGELEWISIRPEYRKLGIATQLLLRLAEWFARRGARRICVDVEPSNTIARSFYARHGATDLKPHWMEWKDIQTLRPPQR